MPADLAQQREALGLANRVRSERAKLKRRLHAGRAHLASVLMSPSPYVATMPVMALLEAAPQLGHSKAARVLRLAGVHESAAVGKLGPETRAAIVAYLRTEYPAMWRGWTRRTA